MLWSLSEGKALVCERSCWGPFLRGDALVLVWGQTLWSLSERGHTGLCLRGEIFFLEGKCPSLFVSYLDLFWWGDALVPLRGDARLCSRSDALVHFRGETSCSLFEDSCLFPCLRGDSLVPENGHLAVCMGKCSGAFLRRDTLVFFWKKLSWSLPERRSHGPCLRGDTLVSVWR